MHLNQNQGFILLFLIIGLCIGACSAEENTGYLMYLQGGSSMLSLGTNDTFTLTINDVIPYYEIQVVDRTLLMPMEETSLYELPLNAALVLNKADGESVYLVKTESWLFDEGKTTLTFEIKPIEFYEGKGLKKFTAIQQNLSADMVGNELSTGMYFEIEGDIPSNTYSAFNRAESAENAEDSREWNPNDPR